MHLSSDSPTPAKRSRAKPKADTATTAAPKKPRSRKKTPAETVIETEVEVIALTPSPDELKGMIATTAYFFAAERNFMPGRELDDWLAAEELILGSLPG